LRENEALRRKTLAYLKFETAEIDRLKMSVDLKEKEVLEGNVREFQNRSS